MIWQLLLAGVLGGVAGVTELGACYRDDPAATLRSLPGLFYLAVNAAAAMGALVVVEAFGWRFGLSPGASTLQLRVVQVLVAGVGSAALFRSSLVTVRQGDQEIGIGPSALLTGLLGLVDRSVDRRRALERLGRDDLAGLSFGRDYVALTELCTGALQNLDRADAQALGELAARLKDEPGLSDAAKLDCFALKLLTLVGPKAVKAAAQRLRERRATESPEPDPAAMSDEAESAEDTEAWRMRLDMVSPLVERPAGSGLLEAALEAAWLHERLSEYDAALSLYQELGDAVTGISSLTSHELEIAWSRTALSSALQLEENFNSRGMYLPPRQIDRLRTEARHRLAGVCSRPGGRPSSYASALYMLAEPEEPASDSALGHLSDALELLYGSPDVGHRGLIYALHFARARCYLARGDAQASNA